MSKQEDAYNHLMDFDFIKKLVVGIGEVSSITGIPIRQIRYWEKKGILKSISDNTTTTRRYDYMNIKKIMLIKELLDEGYTLDASTKKVEQRQAAMNEAFARLSMEQEKDEI